MRLIDADEIGFTDFEIVTCEGSYKNALGLLIYKISNAPTIDAVQVVRCKDCRYMTEHYDTDGNVPYWTCSEWDSGTDYDGFCHYGERKEE